MGWLMGAMMTRQPYSLSVFVHALDRRRERQRLKMGYRRIFAINRERRVARPRARLRPLRAGEREPAAARQRWRATSAPTCSSVSIYQSVRARGPEPDPAPLTEAVDYCADQIESMSDCRVNRGEFQQLELWQSTLPLGRDVARRTRRYATRNVGDTVPLVGTSCGSPTGIPFAFSDPGRTLELLNPYDRTHANYTMLVNGRSGSGKTLAANVILARCIAHGARGFVLDRAGHYGVLTQLVDGRAADRDRRGRQPVRDQSVGRRGPGRRQPREDRLPRLPARRDDGRRRPDHARSARQLGAAIRAVYARAAHTGETPRESTLRDELLAALARGADAGRDRRRGAAAQPRRAAGRVLRRRLLRLPARPRDDCARTTARWSSSTRAAARRSCCGRSCSRSSSTSRARSSATATSTARCRDGRAPRCSPAGRCC